MLIDVPVILQFDATSRTVSPFRAKTVTLRIDTEDDGRPAQIADHYPPRRDAAWITDADGVLLDLLSDGSYQAICARARKSPEDYLAQADEVLA